MTMKPLWFHPKINDCRTDEFRRVEALNLSKSKTILVAHQVYHNGAELERTHP